MSASEPVPEADEQHLVIEIRCPECGAPVEAGLWDHSGRCGFCNSLLVFGGNHENELFVVADAHSADEDLVELLVACRSAAYRAKLEARARSEENPFVEVPALTDARVERFAERLRAELELVQRVDFFAPYRITERAVLQGILGRRPNGPKESFLQSFTTEELERLYDPGGFNLRDRGLKIHGFRLTHLDEPHLSLAQNRLLPIVEPASGSRPGARGGARRFRRSGMRIHPDTQIIAKFSGVWRDRQLTVYKHLTYARMRRAGKEEHLVFDRQFATIAARLGVAEAETYAALAGRDLSRLIPKPTVRAVAAECPNCGWELALPREELISFCRTCKHAVRVDPKGLEIFPYRKVELPTTAPGESVLFYPFWSFPFRLRAGDRDYLRIWDWLESISPQTRAMRFREGDPARSRFFIPARNLQGGEALDRAFANLTGYANWRQPPTAARRPLANQPQKMLGVELGAAEAAGLGRYALLALHDNSSTRRLNSINFKRMIAEAQLDLGEPSLVAVPLVLARGSWRPPGLHAVAAALLEAGPMSARVTRSFSLA